MGDDKSHSYLDEDKISFKERLCNINQVSLLRVVILNLQPYNI